MSPVCFLICEVRARTGVQGPYLGIHAHRQGGGADEDTESGGGIGASWQRMEAGMGGGEMWVGWVPVLSQAGAGKVGGPETSPQLPEPAGGGRG